jgi:hypothetical protein
MSRMIADAKLVFDQLRYAASGPHSTKKAEGFSTLSEQSLEVVPLYCREQGWPPGNRLGVQGLHTVALGASEPLADRGLANAESLGDLALCPAPLVQCPGPQAPTFGPTNGPFGICCAHNQQQSIARPTIIRSLCADQ